MPQNHAQKEDDFLKMADDSILLRRRTLYPTELQRRIRLFLACSDVFASRCMATRIAKEVNPEETREYYQDSYKPSDIITENAEISRFSGTIKRRKGVKRGKQFLNCCRAIAHPLGG